MLGDGVLLSGAETFSIWREIEFLFKLVGKSSLNLLWKEILPIKQTYQQHCKV